MSAHTPPARARQRGQPAAAPRNPVALALAARRASGAAGRHTPSQGARRRAQRMALQRELRGGGA